MPAKLIPLSQGLFATVDEADYEELSAFKWSAHRVGRFTYAVRKEDGVQVSMHREIASPPLGAHVRHANNDGLDNQRANLSLCTIAETLRNLRTVQHTASGFPPSPFYGVSRKPDSKKKGPRWAVHFRVGTSVRYLGLFPTEIEAAKAYDAARKAEGLYTNLNFPA
jgi:hypothetical protein